MDKLFKHNINFINFISSFKIQNVQKIIHYSRDLGCNLGPYTMLAASAGHRVVAVDPLPVNHAHLYNSLGNTEIL